MKNPWTLAGVSGGADAEVAGFGAGAGVGVGYTDAAAAAAADETGPVAAVDTNGEENVSCLANKNVPGSG